MQNSWLSLIPPLVVLLCGFATRRVIFSLLAGIVSAALIAANFSMYHSTVLIVNRLWHNCELWKFTSWNLFWTSWNAFICIFLFILAILVTLIAYSGGAYAYGRFARRRISDAKGAQTAALLLSVFLFIDDYFSSLTVGSVMHPLTDQFKVPRAKLAFLVDAMGAPLAILCPVSSWVAAIIGFLTENGVSLHLTTETFILADPFLVYIRIIPFLFYSFIIMGSAWFIVRHNISFGLMAQHEKIAQTTGNLFGGKKATRQKIRTAPEHNRRNASMTDFAVPVIILIISVIIGMLFSGGYYLFGGPHTLVIALQHANAAKALFVGGTIALGLCTFFFVIKSRIRLQEIPVLYWDGIKLMTPAIIILLLAWTLGDILRVDLLTGQYLASIVVGAVPMSLVPLLFFATAAATSFAIGSSWGTIAILFPIAIPMLITLSALHAPVQLEQLPVLFPVLGAIFSGAVLGDHISPISDTTIMSSTSTGSHHIDHVQTQMIYAMPALLATGLAFLLAGLLVPYGLIAASLIPATVGLSSSMLIFYLVNKKQNA